MDPTVGNKLNYKPEKPVILNEVFRTRSLKHKCEKNISLYCGTLTIKLLFRTFITYGSYRLSSVPLKCIRVARSRPVNREPSSRGLAVRHYHAIHARPRNRPVGRMNLSWMTGAATGNRNNAFYDTPRVLEERKMSSFEDICSPSETGGYCISGFTARFCLLSVRV